MFYLLNINSDLIKKLEEDIKEILNFFELNIDENRLWKNIKEELGEYFIKDLDINLIYYISFNYIKGLILKSYEDMTDENIDYFINGYDTHFYIVNNIGTTAKLNSIVDWEEYYQENFNNYSLQ
ncbi:hypothetical protein [Fusobacterium ulcerans]|uniref:hypothetical protein n=1 Tax=Fusobacterium ulcerans TaxID=861 RepID=UPI0026715F4E|nr:hypothetical protein [Fusobacterium ulcerans]